MNIPIRIAGIGFQVPETVITNEDLTKILDTSDEWIKTRTGIEKRHVLSGNESAVEMGISAAKKALEKLEFIKLFFLTSKEKETYKNKRLENNNINLNKVKVARIEYRGKGQYIDELLK